MTRVQDLIATLTSMPQDAQVVLDLDGDGFLELAVTLDDLGEGNHGVRIHLDTTDPESEEADTDRLLRGGRLHYEQSFSAGVDAALAHLEVDSEIAESVREALKLADLTGR